MFDVLCFLPLLFVFALPAQAAEPPRIRLNSVGYLPAAEKKASLTVPGRDFTVVRVADGAPVLLGQTTGPVTNLDTGEKLYTADFSALFLAGEYRIETPSAGRSAPFRIGPEVYREPFSTVMLGMYLWRCGTAVSAKYRGQTFAHAACHTNDAWLDFVGGGHSRKDATGGWHDAGDYNKYIVNAGLTVGNLLKAWEDFGPQISRVPLPIPEAGGKLPDFLAEVKWELDWVLKMQADDGSAYHKVSTRRFGGFIPPEAEADDRFFVPWGSEATAHFVGMTAQAARVFRPYDRVFARRCLDAAQRGHAFLQANPEFHRADQTGIRTGSYEIRETGESSHRLDGIPNNRLWAEAELWETTGSADILLVLEARIRAIHGHVNFDFDWDEVKNLGLLTYLFSARAGRDPGLVGLVRSNVLAAADAMVQTNRQFGYANPFGARYGWGYNGFVARQTLVLMAADRLTRVETRPAAGGRGAEGLLTRPRPAPSQTEYRAACLDALNHIFGRNYFGRSLVTGIGFQPPQHPHDRRLGWNTGKPAWPGYLVGGPNPTATDWKDDQSDARTNEIALNWNAALIYALAAFLE